MGEAKIQELIKKIEQADLNNEKILDELLEQSLEFDEDRDDEKRGSVKITKEILDRREELKKKASKFIEDNDIEYEVGTYDNIDMDEYGKVKRLTEESQKRIVDMYRIFFEKGDFEQAKVCKYIIEHGKMYSIIYVKNEMNGELCQRNEYKSIYNKDYAEIIAELEEGLRKYEKQQELSERLKKLKGKIKQRTSTQENSKTDEKLEIDEINSKENVQNRRKVETEEQEQLKQQEKNNVENGVWRLFISLDNFGMNNYAYKMMTLKRSLNPSQLEYLKQILKDKDKINKIANKEISEDTIEQVGNLLSKDEKELKDLSDKSDKKGIELLEMKLANERKAEEQARIKVEQETRAKAEDQARIKVEQETRAKAEDQARIKAEQEARAKAEEQARIKAEQEARAKAEEQARIKAEQETKAKAERQGKFKAEYEAMLKQTEIQSSKKSILMEEPQNEQKIQKKESIKDEIGEDINNNQQQIMERKNPTVNLWMNRFNDWYNAIDRVSQSVKTKFVKMKSDIVEAIKDIVKEREVSKEQDTQTKNENER